MQTSGRNEVTVADGVVTKLHGGPSGAERATRALAALGQAGAFGLPVPGAVGLDGGRLRTYEVPAATDGASLLAERPTVVLAAIGGFARELHSLPPPMDWPLPSEPPATFVHGDLCPVNLLFDDRGELVAVVDWEDSHMGEALDDLAWTEWLVRAWHGGAVEHLPILYASADQSVPAPAQRRAAMERCLRRHRDRGDPAADWDAHLAALADLSLDLPGQEPGASS